MAAILLLAAAQSAQAATIVPGGSQVGGQVWTAAGSPYIVDGDITVAANTALFIEAGTEVTFTDTDSTSSGTNPGDAELIVDGALSIAGTLANPVLMRATTPNGTWGGFAVGPSATIFSLVGVNM
jgi:hypothetical protein